MKLKALHIENYGRFSDYDYVFKDGLNEFCEQNGFGKTTIASFIKAMFYGLPSCRANSRDFNDRAHFYPFSGKKFGGNLTFTMGGNEYRIERFFDKKSDSGDSLKVFCNGMPYNGLGPDVGKSVFGIDKESFERTVFIDSTAIDFGATGSISAKLNNFVDGTDGDNTFADAVARLEQAKRSLKQVRGGGKIAETKQDIARLNMQVSNINAVSASLERKYNELNAINGNIRLAEEEKAKSDRAGYIAQLWRTYDSYTEQVNIRKQKISRLDGIYPTGIPSKAQTEELKTISRGLENIRAAASVSSWNSAKQARLDALEGKFASGVPSEEVLDSVDSDIAAFNSLQREVEQLPAGGDGRLASMEKKFAGGVPDEKKLAECESKFARMREIDGRLGVRMTASAPAKSRGNKWFVFGLVAALIVIICGIVAYLFADKLIGGMVMVAGVLILAASVFVHLFSRKVPSVTASDEKMIALQTEKSNLTEEIYKVIAPLGYYSGNGVEYDYLAMKGDLANYMSLKESAVQGKAELDRKNKELGGLYNRLASFFNSYGQGTGNFTYESRVLREDRAELMRLSAERDGSEKNAERVRDEYGRKLQAFNDILVQYKISCTGDPAVLADKIYADSAEYSRIKGEMDEWQAKADSFRVKNNLTVRPAVQIVQNGNMEGMIAAWRKRAAMLENDIFESESEVEKLGGILGVLEEKEEQLAAYQRKYVLLDGAVSLLKRAEQNLKDKYISPVEERFLHYSDMIERTLGEKIIMDSNFNIAFERGGEVKSDKHLSDGQRSICALCFRLALIDNMYREEEPFIIMDDPFVNVDDGHLAKTFRLVKELSGGKQIVYFCCHTSRKIGKRA